MKKFFVLLSSLAIVLSGLLVAAPKATAASVIDQQYTAGTGSVPIDSYLGRFAQTFMPTKTKLDKVQIELTGVVGSKSATVSIRHNVVGVGWDVGNVATVPNQTITNGWNTFDFEDITTTVSETETYGIWVVSNDNGPQWKYTSGPSTYDRGYAIWQSQDKVDWDFNFKTYGYSPASTPADQTTATGTIGTGEALGTTTTSIVKPSNLTAAFSDESKGVKLAWKASTTTDIDGYKIFRSESADKGFTKLAAVPKEKVEYLDQDFVAGKTYYYQVRAYKGDAQSVSTNTASAVVPTDIAPAKPINFKIVDSTFDMITAMWRKSTDPGLAGYTINLYQGKEKIRSTDLSAEFNNYSFFNLEPGTLYKVELIAKNAKDKTSTPAFAFGSTQLPEALENLIDTTKVIAAAIVLLLLLVLVFNTVKHYKKK